MNGRKLRALVDAKDWNGKPRITVVDGRDVDCKGLSLVKLVFSGMKLNINAVVMDRMVEGIDLVGDGDGCNSSVGRSPDQR